jgi:hypothetical protein
MDPEPEKKDAPDDWIDTLAASGVGEAWLRVARRIGFEAFMAAWSELDRAEDLLDERRRVRVPQLSATLFRVQRAQIIRQLGAQGLKAPDIMAALPHRLRVRISRRSVFRILRAR